jgi:hypothetical protein
MMDYGGKHKVSVPDVEADDGQRGNSPNFAIPAWVSVKHGWHAADMQAKAAEDPLAGKSGKDSLSEEEAQLS